MTARWRKLRLKDIVLFVAVAAVVAVLALVAAQELGIDQPPAVGETEAPVTAVDGDKDDAPSESLTLVIGAPATCETETGRGYFMGEAEYDDDGNFLRVARHFTGWFGVSEFEIVWEVRGGTGPYQLTIDGATEDVNGPYQGASGRGLVLCADTDVESYIANSGSGPRSFRGDPEIDSGLKTVRAVVMDAAGNTFETTTDIYVILKDPDILRAGHTYRLWGHLVTAPSTHDIRAYGSHDGDCEYAQEGERCEDVMSVGITDGDIDARLLLWESDLTESHRWHRRLPDGAASGGRMADQLQGASGASGNTIDQAFDAFIKSRNNAPQMEQAEQ